MIPLLYITFCLICTPLFSFMYYKYGFNNKINKTSTRSKRQSTFGISQAPGSFQNKSLEIVYHAMNPTQDKIFSPYKQYKNRVCNENSGQCAQVNFLDPKIMFNKTVTHSVHSQHMFEVLYYLFHPLFLIEIDFRGVMIAFFKVKAQKLKGQVSPILILKLSRSQLECCILIG